MHHAGTSTCTSVCHRMPTNEGRYDVQVLGVQQYSYVVLREYVICIQCSTCTRDIRKTCLSVITAIFWEIKYDRTFSCACAFSQPSERLGELTVRRSCLRESCLSESKCYAWCLSKIICSTWCLKISKILVQILHAVLNLKVDMSSVLKLKV